MARIDINRNPRGKARTQEYSGDNPPEDLNGYFENKSPRGVARESYYQAA